MKIWLLQANEPMPVTHPNERLFRMGLVAQKLNKRGHEVTWFATTFDHFKKKQLFEKDTWVEVNENYKLCLIWAPSYKKNISIKRIINHKYMGLRFRKIAKDLEKPDIIFVSFPTIDFAEEAIRYGKKNNIPIIVDIRDLWPDIFKHNLSKLKGLIATPYICLMDYKTKKLMKEATGIVGISPLIVDWGAKKAGREVLKNDKSFFMGYEKNKNLLDEEKEIENFDKDKFNICFFGTIGNQFDFDLVAEIAKEINDEDIKFVFCGDGPELSNVKEKFKGIENSKFLGWAAKSELNYILNNSKIGIAPYKNTFDFQMSISNKFAEYLSYGLPVIISAIGYMGEFAKENDCGLASREPKEIAKYIQELKENEKRYELVSKNAIKTYEDNFVAEKIYSDLVDYLEEVQRKI